MTPPPPTHPREVQKCWPPMLAHAPSYNYLKFSKGQSSVTLSFSQIVHCSLFFSVGREEQVTDFFRPSENVISLRKSVQMLHRLVLHFTVWFTLYWIKLTTRYYCTALFWEKAKSQLAFATLPLISPTYVTPGTREKGYKCQSWCIL